MSAGSDSEHRATTVRDSNEPRSWHERPVLVGISVLLTLFILPSVVWLLSRNGRSDNGPPTLKPKQAEKLTSLEESGRNAISYAEELLTPDSPQQVRFMNEVKLIQAQWKELHDQTTAWYERRVKMLEGEEGRKLAARADLVERFSKIDQQQRPSLEDVKQLKERLTGFVTIADKIAEPFAVEDDPGEDVFNELSLLAYDVSAALKRIKEVVESVSTLEQEASSLPLAATSLEEAVEGLRQQGMARKADKLVEDRRDQIESKTNELVAAEIEDVGRKFGESLRESRDETAQLERAMRRLEEEAENAAREREEARIKSELQRQFDRAYPGMKGFLTVFTSPGYAQRIGDDFRPTAVRGPVSYGRLVDAGLLNKGEDSFRAFWNVIDKGTNDRDLGAFPAHSFSSGHVERHYETVLKIHDFLRRFGPLMVENGVLAP